MTAATDSSDHICRTVDSATSQSTNRYEACPLVNPHLVGQVCSNVQQLTFDLALAWLEVVLIGLGLICRGILGV